MGYKQLQTEDRNGKPWELVEIPCDRCSGNGVIKSFHYVDRGVCFKCGGSGIETKWRRLLSDKEKAQRLRAKERRVEKKIEEQEARAILFKQEQEVFMDKSTYIVNVSNTYDIKDELKGLGARFNYILNWHFTEPIECDYPTIEIANKLIFDGLKLFKPNASTIVSEIKQNANGTQGKFVGSVADKLTLSLAMVNSFTYDSQYGDGTCYLFKDTDNNTLAWYTSSSIEIVPNEFNETYFIVKSHKVYKEEKQTVIKNVKINKTLDT